MARGYHSFVLAGTGYGKSRIGELYFHMFPSRRKPVVLVLNPLDSLGNDQVREKNKAGITVINLGKMILTKDLATEIKRGDYAFVYLSPEVFINNEMFTELFFSKDFQSRLVLIVIDEAHMVYVWGLVESGKAKFLSARDRIQDYGIFRPSYGKLGDRLMATNGVPLLLLSATCRPVAVESILGSLMLKEVDITFFRGELVRPEIRILRFYMDFPLKSCKDLSKLYSKETEIADEDIVPTLIYSGTRKATLSVMNVLNQARGKNKDDYDSQSSFIRRYHACTGEEDKTDSVKAFEDARFPLFSSTMALGLGQNWNQVRWVIHMGRGDPSTIGQMIGRCGRDGKPGLAMLFMERKRPKGKNEVKDFGNGKKQLTDDDRMDAYAVTPVCLRVASAMDNMYGYIPISKEDPKYCEEETRQKFSKFGDCKCSNCKPEAAQEILKSAHLLTKENFEDVLANPNILAENIPEYIQPKKKRRTTTKYTSRFSEAAVKKIAKDFEEQFAEFYDNMMGGQSEFKAQTFFGPTQAMALAQAFEYIEEPDLIETLIGGEWFDNQVDMLFSFIKAYKHTAWFKQLRSEMDNAKQEIENERQRKEHEKKMEEEKKQKEKITKANEKRAKRAEDAIALEGFKRARAIEAQERRENINIPESSTKTATLQPKAKRSKLSLTEKTQKEEKRAADKLAKEERAANKLAKQAEDTKALEAFKQAHAAQAAKRKEKE